MKFQYIPYIWPLICSALVSLALAVYLFLCQHRSKGCMSIIACTMIAFVWSLANALEMSAFDLQTKLFWANVQYFSYCFSAPVVLIICLQFTGYEHWIKTKNVLRLLIIPTIIIILVWTDGWHGLMRYNIRLDWDGLFPVIAKVYGPVFYIHVTHSYLLHLISVIVLVKAILRDNSVYKRQAVALLVGLGLVIVPNLLYVFGIGPVTRLDLSPIFLAPAGLIFAWGIYRYKLFDLVPMAKTKIFEIIEAGIMILDSRNRVMDMNQAFKKITGIKNEEAMGKDADAVCADIPELLKACFEPVPNWCEFSLSDGENVNIYEILLTPLTDDRGTILGKFIVIHDITQKKRAEEELVKQQRQLAAIEEKEKLAKDMHDSLVQVLGFIGLQAQGIRKELISADIDIVTAKLDKLIEVTQSVHEKIRGFIRDARNSAWAKKGFISVIDEELRIYEKHANLAIKLTVDGGFSGDELEERVRYNILYIIKEALNNINKHAEAQNVRVSFSKGSGKLLITVKDDGKGFDIREYNGGNGVKFGINIMRERALIIGGSMDIDSAPGEGCRIDIALPCKEEKCDAR